MQVYFDKVTEWDIQKGQAVTKIQKFFLDTTMTLEVGSKGQKVHFITPYRQSCLGVPLRHT